MISQGNREFIYTDGDFRYLSQVAGDIAGINLTDAKRELVYSRLSKRIRNLGMKSFREYCNLLKRGDEEEFTYFINAITTNVTSFFREKHHFEFLKNEFLPQFVSKNERSVQPRLRIWSAGCSSGEEPYSIAITLKENISNINRWDAKILATDLDSNILEVAKKGVYLPEKTENMPQNYRKRWFRASVGRNKDMLEISDEIKKMVTFRKLNLSGNWPMQGPFDAIFCRNVMIYFDKSIRKTLINRFADILAQDGCLFVGHSESLFSITKRFEAVGQTVHRKIP